MKMLSSTLLLSVEGRGCWVCEISSNVIYQAEPNEKHIRESVFFLGVWSSTWKRKGKETKRSS